MSNKPNITYVLSISWLPLAEPWRITATIAAGGLSGGVASSMAGGDFWDGLCNGLISSGLNHAMHLVADGLSPDDPPKGKASSNDVSADENNLGLGIGFANAVGTNGLKELSEIWKNPQKASRAQKEIIQKKAYSIQKAQKANGVSQSVKEIKFARGTQIGKLGRYGGTAVGASVETADMLYNREVNASNVAGIVVTGVAYFVPEVGAVYLIIDLGCLIFTGDSFGEHLNSWTGKPLFKW